MRCCREGTSACLLGGLLLLRLRGLTAAPRAPRSPVWPTPPVVMVRPEFMTPEDWERDRLSRGTRRCQCCRAALGQALGHCREASCNEVQERVSASLEGLQPLQGMTGVHLDKK